MDWLAYTRLQEAWQWIQLGEHDHAANLLTVMLASDPDNVEAWWMLAIASSDQDTRRRALRNVLRLRPDDRRAWRMFDSLGARPATQELRPVIIHRPALAGGHSPPYFGQELAPELTPQWPPLRRRTPPRRDPWRTPRWAVTIVIAAATFGLIGSGLLLCTAALTGWTINSRLFGASLPAPTPVLRPGVPVVSLRGGLRYDQWQDGRIDGAGQLDGYNFSGHFGDQVAVQVRALERMTLQPVVGLYGPEQKLLSMNATPDGDSTLRLAYALPGDGEFLIVVSGQAATAGPYRLMLRRAG